MIGKLRQIAERIRSVENDVQFELELVRIARMGLWLGGVMGLLATLLFVGTKVFIVGDAPGWRYAQDTVVLWDKILLAALSLTAVGVADRLGLRGIRLLTAAIIVLGSLASVTDDIGVGKTAFSPGFLTFMYLLAVVGIPYRPMQTLGLGVLLMTTLLVAVEYAPGVLGVEPVRHNEGHFIYLTIMTGLLTGLSALLYSIRVDLVRARRTAEEYGERLAELEAAKSRFFVNISHELRTPLTLILGPLDDALAGRFGELGDAFRRRLDVMGTQARKLRELVDQLLDLSRLEDGALTLSVAEADLVRFVREQAEMFRSIADRRGLELHVDVPDMPVPVWFDREKIGQVLSNLLSNAIKFTDRGGSIRVRVSKSGSGLAELSVRDNGRGIDAEELSTVFDRFKSSGRAPDGQVGTGIGLALVKEIVERHGGSVHATSEPGFGSEFFVMLPPRSVHANPAVQPGAPRIEHGLPMEDRDPAPVSGREATDALSGPDAPLVLVVDDNDLIREYICDAIGADYRVAEAADGEEAWTFIREHRPALVISDVFMPVLGGYDLCARIRDNESTAATPVILITAGQDDEWRLEGWRTGADAFLAKPFSGGEILALTENLIDIRDLLGGFSRIPDWMDSRAAALSSPEAEFLGRLQDIVGEHIGNSAFGVEWLADEVGLSARQLQRRLKKTTRLTAAGFIKTMRLEHAARLIAAQSLQIQEVAHAVGYQDASYFSQQFRQVYGVPPSEYDGGTA